MIRRLLIFCCLRLTAYLSGWRIDADGWWTRPLRKGDTPIGDSAIGFLADHSLPGEPAGPYVRTAALALAYDGAAA
jgi:hypothetical protein